MFDLSDLEEMSSSAAPPPPDRPCSPGLVLGLDFPHSRCAVRYVCSVCGMAGAVVEGDAADMRSVSAMALGAWEEGLTALCRG